MMLKTTKKSEKFKSIPHSCQNLQNDHLFTMLLSGMEEAQEQGPEHMSCLTGSGAKKMLDSENVNSELQIKVPWQRKYLFWLQVTIYAMLLLAGQSVGTLLGNMYYDNGGKSNWLATLLSNLGFPLIIPFVFISPAQRNNEETNISMPWMIIVLVYVFLGLLLAVNSMLTSIGLRNLTVSTYALITASQLTFNAIFSVIFNGEILTFPILNSLVLLTLSSILLVFQGDSEDNKNRNKHFAVGFICTLAGSAGYSLMLSLTELTFQKVFRKQNFKVIVDMSIYQSLVATIAILVGLFASGDWKTLGTEMENFEGGKTAYIMNLFWTAVCWQLYTIGCLGLILKVSSLFSNAISVMGCPLAPVFAVIFLNEKVTGVKVISLLLAIWGILSYGYQNYLDDLKTTEEEGKCSYVAPPPPPPVPFGSETNESPDRRKWN